MSILGMCSLSIASCEYCRAYYHVMLRSDTANGVFRFSDTAAEPDPHFSDYDLRIKGTGAAIIIDNGIMHYCHQILSLHFQQFLL